MRLKGSITVFMSIILAALIAFSGIIVDISRLRTGEKHARAAVQLSVQSALTQFHAPLKEHYGLMAVGQEQEETEALIYDLLEKNLAAENRYMPGYVDLYGFEVEDVTVTPFFNLSEDYVLEQQITQFMKYRAPVNTIGNFIEKLRALNTCMAQSGLLNKRMDLEKKLQKIREEQVYLSLLLSERIHGYTTDKDLKTTPETVNRLSSAHALIQQIQQLESPEGELDAAWKTMPGFIEKIKKTQESIRVLENEIIGLERKRASCSREYDEIEDEILWYDQEISLKNSEIDILKSSIRSDREALQTKVDFCVFRLRQIHEKAEAVHSNISEIENTIRKYARYHEQAIVLLDEIKIGCDTIGQLTSDINREIEKQSEKSDSAFLTRIQTDIKKLVLNADPVVVSEIRADMESNLQCLGSLLSALVRAREKMVQINYGLGLFTIKTENISIDCGCIERDVFGSQLHEEVQPLKGLMDITAGSCKKPSYPVEPVINQKERNEFFKWCNLVFIEENEIDTSKDKGYQKKVKQNILESDEENQANQKIYNGEDGKLSDRELKELFSTLPSYRDKNGVYINVKNSEYTKDSVQTESLLPECEEKEKDIEVSYGKALNRNGNIAARIGEMLADTGEALLDGLYVNEFIVSAFKNANIDKVVTPRINLFGAPNKTFYEKAEAEYVIFGAKKEKTNANLAQASIFGIRMGLNLIHVYTNSDKTAAALTIAASIAGWTGFGVPVVKNLILTGWAAGESWMDMKDINGGKPVPVYKTRNTWKLDLKSIFTGIAGDIINESADWLKETKDDVLDEGEKALQSVVHEMVSSMVHEAFLPADQVVTELEGGLGSISVSLPANLKLPDNFSCLEDLKYWAAGAVQKQFESIKDEAVNWSRLKLEEYKRKTTDAFLDFIFKSTAYKNMVSHMKGGINDLINSGANQLTDAVKKLSDRIEDTGIKEKLIGAVVSFDYIDYLRLLLFVVPGKTKLMRSADLIQLNMKETLDNPDFIMSNYHSFLIVEADISIRFMFIPDTAGRDGKGRIRIRWGYGY